jgi:dipeptide transport system substrate-binding protein
MKRAIWVLMLFVLEFLSASAGAKTLTYCSEGNPESLSPIFNTNTTSMDVTGQMYESLVAFSKGTTQIRPSLAERWTVSPDGLTYKFFLRKGVKWHSNAWFKPTRDFNADDVLFSIQRQWQKDHPFFKVTSDQHPYFNDMSMGQLLQSVEKLNSHTVLITLKQPVAPLLANLAMSWANMYSSEYAKAMLAHGTPEYVDQHPIGTGPFQFVSYEKNAHVKFKAFDAYWAGRGKVESLVFLIEPNPKQRLAHLQSGECQVLAYPNPIDLQKIMTDPQLKLLSQTGLNVGYLAYNTQKKPFDDVRVRRALNMAINKRKILRAVYNHTAVPAINPFPPIQWSYNREIEDDEYNPSRARTLLSEAGYPDGFQTELWAMSVTRPYIPDALAVARLIKADLAEVGVNLEIKSPDWAVYPRGLRAGEHEMALYGWTSDNGDPDNFLNTLLGCSAVNGSNVAKFCHAPYDDLIKAASQTSRFEARTRMYQQAQVIFKQQAPWFTIAHATQFKAIRTNVVGYELSPMGVSEFFQVDVIAPVGP